MISLRSIIKIVALFTITASLVLTSCTDAAPGPAYTDKAPEATMSGGTGGTGNGNGSGNSGTGGTGSGSSGDDDDPIIQQNLPVDETGNTKPAI